MDRYFYILEEENGKRVIHMQGNVYYNNADGSNKKYRSAEWTSLYFDIDEALAMQKDLPEYMWEVARALSV